MAQINKGDVVWVHPHGSPAQAAQATVEVISANQKSIGLTLADKPEWVRVLEDGVLLGPGGIVMLLMRESFGPWREIAGGGHYEIESEKPCRV
jgi:hypothetical protein